MSCERNNMASKRSYETSMDHATVYEHAIAHLELLHESLPKEESKNEHRPKRLMTKQEPTDEADAMALF